ncbi:MFS quinate transporter [Penicillium canariense]|uniref:MFS quinate transporter n=1 Tax=Penicillium canariense TaxID=189055 RepID=A0A9W9HSX7_9EURO|nr:MFS quinate transporter [Penicillium canariense]KAJ5156901.1 MFS quinate transporter [Penicillium canariense]
MPLPIPPREVLNWRLFYAVICFGLMGAARGLDEGLIGTTVAQKSFMSEYGLVPSKKPTTAELAMLANRKGNITAMVQIGSVGGALLAFILCDKLGRLWAARQLCCVWIIGTIVYITANGNYGQILAGRFVMGLGIGQTTVVAPAYLTEVAPRTIRGLCVCIFSGSVYLGIMLGYFANFGTSLHISNKNSLQWVEPTLMHIIFASIIFVMSFFALESPRWLCKVKRYDEAAAMMAKLRHLPEDHHYVRTELIDIRDQLEREQEATMGSSFFGPLKELFLIGSNRYRIVLGLMCQLLGQWSGANSMTIYAPQFFQLLGTTGQSESLFATAIFGVVKLVSALTCAFFLVDFIGRKRALSIGIIIQFIAMLYIAIYLTSVPTITAGKVQSGAAKHAATGAIAMIYFSGVGWALGWNSIQYLIGAEIFPLRVRALGTSIIMCFHFINQYGNSKAVPLMLLTQSPGLKPQGTFWFFAAVTLLGLVYVWFFVPETAGKSLEAMDEMFGLPWHVIGRKGAKLTEGMGALSEMVGHVDNEKLAQLEAEHAEHYEHAPQARAELATERA